MQSLHHTNTGKMNTNANHGGPQPPPCGPGQPTPGLCLSHTDPGDPSNLTVIFHLATYHGQSLQKASTVACRFWVLQYLLSETAQLFTLVTHSNYKNSKISYCHSKLIISRNKQLQKTLQEVITDEEQVLPNIQLRNAAQDRPEPEVMSK